MGMQMLFLHIVIYLIKKFKLLRSIDFGESDNEKLHYSTQIL